MERYKRQFFLKEEARISPIVAKLIKAFHLKRRLGEKRTFFEGSAASYGDDHIFKKYIPDFKLVDETITGFKWDGYSKKELIHVQYVERDMYLIVYNNINELNKSIRDSIEWDKKYG